MQDELLEKMWSEVEKDEDFKQEIISQFKDKIRKAVDELNVLPMLENELAGRLSENIAEGIVDELNYRSLADKLQEKIEIKLFNE